MTVRELRQRLFEIEDQDAEVRLAYQENYPLQDNIRGVSELGGVAYVVSAGQVYDEPYAPRAAFEEAF